MLDQGDNGMRPISKCFNLCKLVFEHGSGFDPSFQFQRGSGYVQSLRINTGVQHPSFFPTKINNLNNLSPCVPSLDRMSYGTVIRVTRRHGSSFGP